MAICKIENNHRAWRLPRVLRGRSVEAGLPAPRAQRRDLFDSRARAAGADRAGIRHRRLSRRGRVSRARRRRRQRAGVAPGVARDRARGRRVVRLGRGRRCRRARSFTASPCTRTAPGGVIVLTGVWALLRAERGGAIRRRERLGPGGCTAPRWRCCRGSTRASRCLPAASARSFCCGSSTNRNAAGKAVAFLTIPALSAHLLDRLFHRHLRHARSVVSVRATKRDRVASFPAAWPDCSSISGSVCSRTRRC